MKTMITKSLMAVAAVLLITSCSTSNDVASNRGIQKRKYNKGFYMSKKSNGFDKAKEVENEVAINEKSTPIVQEKESISESVTVNEVVAEFPVTEKTEVIVTKEINSTAVISSKSDEESINEEVEVTDLKSVKTVERTNKKAAIKNKKSNNKAKTNSSSDVPMIVLVILALFIPPLAVFLYEGITTRFWINLILTLLLITAIIAVIHAILIVTGTI